MKKEKEQKHNKSLRIEKMIFIDDSKNERLINLEQLIQLEIKCFQHCSKTERYLCFDLPEMCPSCLANLNSVENTKFRVPPFIVPKPLNLTNTQINYLPPMSLLLQPTDGDYDKLIINNVKDMLSTEIGDLHIGVTSTFGEVFDFDSNGLNRNSLKWTSLPSIVIRLDNKITLNLNDDEIDDSKIKWDVVLEKNWDERFNKWNEKNYDELNWNCLDFIISFLVEYGFFDLNQDYDLENDVFKGEMEFQNKVIIKKYLRKKLSNELIEPEFLKCLKYFSLLVKINEKKYFIEQVSF